ncbi:MAG: MFS transporter [Elusimicrobia bacterium]|nr:MFS transporter [Elusimicrobiota bacterium]
MNNKAYPRKVLLLIFSISLFNYIDRQVLYAVFPLIKTDLGLSDMQLGFLASSFMIVYMCFAPVTGYFGDRIRRPLVIGISAIFWSIATVFTGFAKNYSHLILARSAVGIGEAGYGPVSPAYLAEWFPLKGRARIMALYALAVPVGSAMGYLLGGVLGENFGWRNAFFIVAVPGMLLGIIATLFKETPEKISQPEKIKFGEYKKIFKNKTFLLIVFSMAVGTFSIGGLAAWMPSYLVRNFSLSVANAGFLFGAITVLAGIMGNLTGGWIADALKKKIKRAYFIVGYVSFFLSVPFGITAVLTDNLHFAVAMIFLTEFFVFMHSGPYHAAIIGIMPVKMRSMAFAVCIFIIHAFGDAISPTLIGYVSDLHGLRIAVFICVLFILFAVFLSLFAGRQYMIEHHDEKESNEI